MTEQQAMSQYAPPEMHHTITEEKAIQTWKNYFKAGSAIVPKNFQIACLCQLPKQADIMHNLLHKIK